MMIPILWSLDVNLETRPAVPEPSPLAGAGDDTQAAVTGQAAHVNDAVNAVCAQRPSTVGSVEVPQVDAVSYPSNDGSCESGTCRPPWLQTGGLLRTGVLPAAPEVFLGAGMGHGARICLIAPRQW